MAGAPHLETSLAPTRSGVVGSLVLLPVLVAAAYVEVVAVVADSLDDIQAKAHHATGPLWLGIFAVLGIAGPVAAGLTAWHTKTEGRSSWQAVLRGEMAFVLVGIPAALLLLMA